MSHEETIGGEGTLYKGEDKTLLWRIYDRNGALVDITGWTMRFVVRVRDSAPTAVLDMAVDVTGTYHATPASNTQYARCILTDTDLSIPAPKIYRYSLKRLNDGYEDILRAGPMVVELATQV